MKELPQLKPLNLRPETEPGYDPIAWRPNWKCFCCHDTGLVSYVLVKRVMPDYDDRRHKPVKCNASGCDIRLSELLFSTRTLDERLDSCVCDELDTVERRAWQEWSHSKHELRKKALKLTDTSSLHNNLRNRSRNASEQLEIQRRHQTIVDEW